MEIARPARASREEAIRYRDPATGDTWAGRGILRGKREEHRRSCSRIRW